MENSYIPIRPLFRWALSLILSFGLCLPLMAQNQISGTVTDPGGEAIIGANVSVKGTTNGTITNIDGQFELNVEDPQATLLITFVGFLSQEIEINGRSEFDITLMEDIKQLDELVVVGYGVQKKKVVTGAVASIDSEEIKKSPAIRADQVLQGRTPGVQVTNGSGQPGSGLMIRVRGNGTLRGGEPLYIVDGMQVDDIKFLNPSDIETIDVLKDGGSIAIYGASGANGVVLITTKTGEAGKMKLSYDMHYGVQNVRRTIPVLNAREYMTLRNEAANNSGYSLPFPNINEAENVQGTNWQDEIFNSNAPMVRHQFELSGGTDKSLISSSFGYNTQQGIIGGEKSTFERYNFNMNASQKFNDRIKVTTRLKYIHSSQSAVDPNNEYSSPIAMALNMDPLTPVYQTDSDVTAGYPQNAVTSEDGRYYGISDQLTGGELVNPLAFMEILNGPTLANHFIGQLEGEVKIIKGLTFRTMGGADYYTDKRRSFNPLFTLNSSRLNERKSVGAFAQYRLNMNLDNTLTYTTSFGNHNVKLLAGNNIFSSYYENLAGGRQDFLFDSYENAYLNGAAEAEMTSGGGASHWARASFFGRASYDYKEKYLFQAILRADGSSKFGENNRFGYFPSVSVGWVISDEEFLKNSSLISFMKLRASYGENGNDNIGLYQYTSRIQNGYGYTFADGYANGAAPANVSNPDLRWETSVQSNVGIDVQFLQNRLGLSLDLYDKRTLDMLDIGIIPAHVGNNPPSMNMGSVRNQGIELALNFRNQQNDFEYSAGVNMAYNVNKMTDVVGQKDFFDGGGHQSFNSPFIRSQVGEAMGSFYGYETDGIFQNWDEVAAYVDSEGNLIQPFAQPGDVRFKDNNGNGEIDTGDRAFIGNPIPDLTFGVNLSASYKGFDAMVFISGALGQELAKVYRRNDMPYTNMPAEYLNRWTGEGTSDKMPRLTENDTNGNLSSFSDLFVEDASFARIRTVQLGYTFDAPAGNRMGLSSARVYLSADNLFTFTKYSGLDPEVGGSGINNVGIDRGNYPLPRTFMVGANISF